MYRHLIKSRGKGSWLIMGLFSFIERSGIKSYQIKHLPHAGSDPVAIGGFQFGCAQVGGDVRLDFPVDQQIVAAQEDPGHDVGFGAELFHRGFCSQVISNRQGGQTYFGLIKILIKDLLT